MKKTHRLLWSILAITSAVLCGVSTAGYFITQEYQPQLDSFLKIKGYKTVEKKTDENLTEEEKKEKTTYFKSQFSSLEEQLETERQLCTDLEKEGATLLKNDNEALPLAKTSKFSCFSESSVNPIYGGTGSGSVAVEDAVNLKDALENSFGKGAVNETLWNHYANDLKDYRRVNASTTGGKASDYMIGEAPWEKVATSDVEASFANYGDVALVVLARSGGEGNDLPVTEGADATDGNYLVLSKEEKDMLLALKAYKDNQVFSKIVVLLNGSNAMQLDFLFDSSYGIDAALWIGDVGTSGFAGVAEILNGDVNPSGKLSDTYLKDNLHNPVLANFGLHPFTNSSKGTGEYTTSWAQYNQKGKVDGCNENYIVYQEGIYVGYRYYETRYEDVLLGQENTGDYSYHDVVAYPFGFGLSYTTFAYTDYELSEKDGTFTAKVKVENTGDVAGKKAVEIYAQTPYTDYDRENGIEKSSIQLVGFEKTGLIEPGNEEEVTITFNKHDFATYDSNNAKTYILDAGDYYFTVGDDAHKALNNILSAKGFDDRVAADEKGDAGLVQSWKVNSLDTKSVSTSQYTDKKITNAFDFADISKYEGTKDQKINYLSRSNWKDTYPTKAVDLKITEQMWKDGLTDNDEDRAQIVERMKQKYYPDLLKEKLPTMGSAPALQLVSLRETEDTNKAWDALIQQASYDDMTNVIYNGFHMTNQLASIGLPSTFDENGPQGFTKSLVGGAGAEVKPMAYTSEDIMASTRNRELTRKMGEYIGEDCLRAGTAGLYGPGANIHRTAYCGRNFEYYSEDPILSVLMSTPEIEGIQSKGVYVFMKHFALNDQETSRYGLSTWANEQSIREIYLRAFEGLPRSNGLGVMTSFNRLGVVWSGASYSLMTTVLREEWGIKGAAITDCSVYASFMHHTMGILAGQDLWDGNSGMKQVRMRSLDNYKEDPVVTRCAQRATKRIAYSISRSLAMNGLSPDTVIVPVESWYLVLLKWMSLGFGVVALGFGTLIVLDSVRKKKQSE